MTETTTGETLHVGDYVRLRPSVDAPRYGWGQLTRTTVGRVVANAVTDNDAVGVLIAGRDMAWLGDPSELERVEAPRPLRVGDLVRVRRHVVCPRFGWGAVDHDSIGMLASVDHSELAQAMEHRVNAKVRFAVHAAPWNARADQLELALGPDVPHAHRQERTRLRRCGPRPAQQSTAPPPPTDDRASDPTDDPLTDVLASSYARHLKRKREDAVQEFTDFVDDLQAKGTVNEQTWKTLLDLGMKLYAS